MYPNYYKVNSLSNNVNRQTNSEELITFTQAINLIKSSVNDEYEDEMFYNTIINQAPSEKEKNIIRGIRDDERRHNQILRNLYYEFTNEYLPVNNQIGNINTNMNYKDNLKKALFGELSAVTKYRKIMGAMPTKDSYTLLMSIMTDEIRHANEYNYLITIS